MPESWPHLLVPSSQGRLLQASQALLLLRCSPRLARQHQLQRGVACCIDLSCEICCCC